jgi:hypothetical protein
MDSKPDTVRRRNAAHKRLMIAFRTFAQIEAPERRPRRTVQVCVVDEA